MIESIIKNHPLLAVWYDALWREVPMFEPWCSMFSLRAVASADHQLPTDQKKKKKKKELELKNSMRILDEMSKLSLTLTWHARMSDLQFSALVNDRLDAGKK